MGNWTLNKVHKKIVINTHYNNFIQRYTAVNISINVDNNIIVMLRNKKYNGSWEIVIFI